MLGTRDLLRRIRSIGNTAKITNTMQMVAASKMRRAQQAALAGRPFVRLLYRIQRRATTQALDFTHPLLERREVAAVHYPGLPAHPQADLVRRQMTHAGGLLSFELVGGEAAAADERGGRLPA